MLNTHLSSGIKEEHQKSENKTYYHLLEVEGMWNRAEIPQKDKAGLNLMTTSRPF